MTKRLGRGASAVAFVVQDRGHERVLKLAADAEHNPRLRQEGETLHKLRHQAIIAYHETRDVLGHTGLLLDHAAEGTLAERLRKLGPIQLELLERFGDDLLSALRHLEDKGISHRDIKPPMPSATICWPSSRSWRPCRRWPSCSTAPTTRSGSSRSRPTAPRP